MKSLEIINILSRRMQQPSNGYLHLLKPRSFHVNSRLLDEKTFNEKPEWLKKLKLKQAQMQKDDGVPVYLKNGLFDKILYNFTLGATIGTVFYGFKILHDLSKT